MGGDNEYMDYNMQFRKEKDMIGELDIPVKALYGIYTARTVRNLSFSEKTLDKYPEYIKALAMVKKAAARANLQAGVLNERLCSAIEQACDELLEGKYLDQFPIDMLHGGGGVGSNMNVNEVIANLSNEALGGTRGVYDPIHPNDHVSASQSTTDVCFTAMRIAILSTWHHLNDELHVMVASMNEKAQSLLPVQTISRTCLQDGMPVSLGDFFSGYSSLLERRIMELKRSVMKLHAVNLGGTVIGSGYGAPKIYREVVIEQLCRVTQFPLSLRGNLYDAAQNFDDLAEVSSQLALLSRALIKITKDIRLLSSGPEAGFNEIELPAVQGGSSFYPGKINPIVPETLIQCCLQVLGNDRVVQAALEHGELNVNVFEGIAGTSILDSMKMFTRSIALFVELCLKDLRANQERCEQLANSLFPTSIRLKEKYGYVAVSNLFNQAAEQGINIKELMENQGYSAK
jgi:aspartate ammonia-lyase